VDAGDVQRVLANPQRDGLQLEAILVMLHHPDHIGAATHAMASPRRSGVNTSIHPE
jgi:glyoxylase-like metal-dependent hydrolase (beta-lactamase superfamily II)